MGSEAAWRSLVVFWPSRGMLDTILSQLAYAYAISDAILRRLHLSWNHLDTQGSQGCPEMTQPFNRTEFVDHQRSLFRARGRHELAYP
eukprot:8503100-Pyramimonas_sp.AAC.1